MGQLFMGAFLLFFSLVRMGTCYDYNMHSFAFGKSRGPGRHFQNDPGERVGEDFADSLEPDVRERFLDILRKLERSA